MRFSKVCFQCKINVSIDYTSPPSRSDEELPLLVSRKCAEGNKLLSEITNLCKSGKYIAFPGNESSSFCARSPGVSYFVRLQKKINTRGENQKQLITPTEDTDCRIGNLAFQPYPACHPTGSRSFRTLGSHSLGQGRTAMFSCRSVTPSRRSKFWRLMTSVCPNCRNCYIILFVFCLRLFLSFFFLFFFSIPG